MNVKTYIDAALATESYVNCNSMLRRTHDTLLVKSKCPRRVSQPK